jgi:amidohydrolase
MRHLACASLLLVGCGSKTSDIPLAAITAQAESLNPQLIDLRRDIHSHPELSLAEVRTAGVIADRLRALNLEVHAGVGGNGVVGILRGALSGPVVGYRADMDAMPMQEPPGRAYGSTVPGVFHVCGHDLHSAIGVGIAGVLGSMRDKMHGTVVFYFQSAEETLQGAAEMILNGALADPRPEIIYAIHDWPLPTGTMAYGTVFAGLDKFTVEIDGANATATIVDQVKAGLKPLSTVSLPMTPDDITKALADMRDPTGPFANFVFLSLSSSINGASAVIRGSVKASSDSMYPALRQSVRDALTKILDPSAYTLSFAYDTAFPSMASDPGVSDDAAPLLVKTLGPSNVFALKTSWPFNGEDFALFLKQRPGAMFLLGVANPAKGFSGVPHSPDFDADEDALVLGTKSMSAVIWQRLSRD